jgi:hypothetical protein
MILGAAMRIREDVERKHSGQEKDRIIRFEPRERHKGRERTVQTHFGGFFPGTGAKTGRQEPEPEPVCAKQFPFENDHVIRPWLFGNWWDLGFVEANPQQLVGLGVRLEDRPLSSTARGTRLVLEELTGQRRASSR